MKTLIPFLGALLVAFSSFGSHIIGGEMSYTYMGNNVYHVTMKVYRDCLNGQATFDNPGYITVFDADNNIVETLTIPLVPTDTIPLSMSCSGLPVTICAEEAVYEADVTLPPAEGGYTLTYQRCCRSTIIGNIVDPFEVGMTITTNIPDPLIVAGNTGPVFNNYPPTAFCVGIPIFFDHSAVDADGDSLAYEFCSGIEGADALNPYPFPALPPPYAEILYLTPYSGSYPFDSDPALAINPVTGIITGTPSSIGIFTLGVNVKEYRDGVLIGNHRREMAQVFTVVGLPTATTDVEAGNDLSIFPVPATNELSIFTGSSNQVKELNVLDLAGKLIYHQTVEEKDTEIHLSLDHFQNGKYFLQLIRENSVESKPFIVTR